MLNKHSEVYPLLPWYVNNSMDQQQKTETKIHLEQCLTCRIEVEQLQQLSRIIIRSNQSEITSSAAFSNLKTRIIQHDNGDIGLNQWINQRLSRIENAILQTCVVLILTTLLTIIPVQIDDDFIKNRVNHNNHYHSLSSQKIHQTRKTDIRVVFDDDLEKSEILQITSDLGAKIIDGPSLNGAYRVRLLNQNDSINPQLVLQQIRSNPQVIFAEPAIAFLNSSGTSTESHSP